MEGYKFDNLASRPVLSDALELGKVCDYEGRFTFSFPAGRTYDPFGMLLAGAAVRQFVTRNPNAKCFCEIHGSGDAYKYAGHMGFFKSISEKLPYGKLPGEARGSEKYVPITPINLSVIRSRALREGVPVQQQIQTTAQNLSRVLSQGNIPLCQTLTYVLREIIRNAEEHSHADLVWVCAQHWPHYQLVEIAILDEGMGIKRSLKSNRYFSRSIQTDRDALKLCLLPGVSEAYKRRDDDEDPWANSGYGLYIAKEICRRLEGLFLIASGNSSVGHHTSCHELIDDDSQTCIGGTAVCIRFKTDRISDFEDVRATIIKEGQAEARSVNNRIKKASYSSGGLIELLK